MKDRKDEGKRDTKREKYKNGRAGRNRKRKQERKKGGSEGGEWGVREWGRGVEEGGKTYILGFDYSL